MQHHAARETVGQRRRLEEDGHVRLPRLLTQRACRQLDAALEAAAGRDGSGRRRRGELYGMRDVLASVPDVVPLLGSGPCGELLREVLGASALAVRGLVFDKTPAANWRLGWHQDRALAVAARHDIPGWGPWSVKAGVPHVLAPAHVLQGMLTVRLHLDSCDESNGALRVIPGSHHRGILEREALREAAGAAVTCTAERGDALVMRPLLVHCSERSAAPSRRRVLHVELAPGPLERPLRWHRALALSKRSEAERPR